MRIRKSRNVGILKIESGGIECFLAKICAFFPQNTRKSHEKACGFPIIVQMQQFSLKLNPPLESVMCTKKRPLGLSG